MAGFIILEDGRAYAANNWSYDRLIEKIAETFPDTETGREFSDWLLGQRVSVRGIGNVDLRELTPSNRQLFVMAAETALSIAEREGSAGWCDPDFYPGWLERFRDLIKMIESVRRDEPPSTFNPHMNDVIPLSGRRAGPGWDEQRQGRSIVGTFHSGIGPAGMRKG